MLLNGHFIKPGHGVVKPLHGNLACCYKWLQMIWNDNGQRSASNGSNDNVAFDWVVVVPHWRLRSLLLFYLLIFVFNARIVLPCFMSYSLLACSSGSVTAPLAYILKPFQWWQTHFLAECHAWGTERKRNWSFSSPFGQSSDLFTKCHAVMLWIFAAFLFFSKEGPYNAKWLGCGVAVCTKSLVFPLGTGTLHPVLQSSSSTICHSPQLNHKHIKAKLQREGRHAPHFKSSIKRKKLTTKGWVQKKMHIKVQSFNVGHMKRKERLKHNLSLHKILW